MYSTRRIKNDNAAGAKAKGRNIVRSDGIGKRRHKEGIKREASCNSREGSS
jgi:hypothetical protein